MHKLSVASLPQVRTKKVYTPRTQTARHAVLDGDRVVFVSRGHLMSEPARGGTATVIDAGSVDGVWGSVSVAHGVVVGLRIDARGVPPRPRSVDVIGGPSVHAHTFGVAADAPLAIAVDVKSGKVHALDLALKTKRLVTQLETHQGIEVPGLVSVSPDGSHALLTLASSAHGDSWLVDVDVVEGTARAVHPPLSQGSVVGAQWGKHLVVLEQSLGDEPRLRVLVDGTVLIARDGIHPLAVPLALSDTHLLLLAVPHPDAMTRTGDAQLCVLDRSGTLTPLAPASGTRIRRDGERVIVEDGKSVTRLTLTR